MTIVDPTRFVTTAAIRRAVAGRDTEVPLLNCGQYGGEYLDSIGKTDLATLSADEWMTFIESIITGYHDKLYSNENPPF